MKNETLKNNLVKLNQFELQKLAKGELTYINNPEKGISKVDMENVYVAIF